MKHFVYRHIRLDTNEPFYIGIGTKRSKYPGRWNTEYMRAFNKSKRNILWKRIADKTKFEVEIIFESDNYELVKQKEIEFIKLYGTKADKTGPLANITKGGDGFLGRKLSTEAINKLQHHRKLKGKIKNNNRTVYQYDINGRFVKSWNSTIDAARFFNLGSSSIANAARLKSHHTARFFWFYDYQGETINIPANFRLNHRGPVGMVDVNTNKIIKIFRNVSEAYLFINKSHSGLIRRVINTESTAYGYKWITP